MTRLTTTLGSRLPRAAWVLLVLPLLGLNCPLSTSVDCAGGEPEFAIQVGFYDGITDERLTGPTPGKIQDGSYQDSLQVSGYDGDGMVAQMAAGLERKGTYVLTAMRSGYTPYSQSGIRVDAYDCGVATVFVKAELERE